MFPKNIEIPLPGGLHGPLPRFVEIGQKLSIEAVKDVDATIAHEFAKFSNIELKGKTVAIGIGSRGIKQQAPVVEALIRELKATGAIPFMFPAMGSHGGGTAEGQKGVLAEYGYTEATFGVPVKASMDVVEVGQLEDRTPVYCDKFAYEADYIIPVNRVKPHTSFRGKHESGLAKMLAIGVSKHAGAAALHFHGFAHFHHLISEVAQVSLDNTNVLFGVGMVENSLEDLRMVEFVGPKNYLVRDAALLEIAKACIPQLLIKDIDVLIVDQLGKNISGAGMDPNVTGRCGAGMPGFDVGLCIGRIVVRDLTDKTQGNASGMGTADVTTQRMLNKIDWTKTYTNMVTAGVINGARLPIVANTDRDAFGIAVRGCPGVNSQEARIVRIRNTLELTTIWVSEILLPEIVDNPQLEIKSEPFELKFDSEDALKGEIKL
jgi:hypothetical protein